MNREYKLIPIEKVAHTLPERGFAFNWKRLVVNNLIVGEITVENELAGMVAFRRERNSHKVELLEVSEYFRKQGVAARLLAFVAKDSITTGNEGHFHLISKTSLRDFYLHLGGFELPGRVMEFNELASRDLIEKYFSEGSNDEDTGETC